MAMPELVLMPVGSIGRWFATWNNEDFPCIHDYWIDKGHYRDPYVSDNPKWKRFIEAIQKGKHVIVTYDQSDSEGNPNGNRGGYIGLWRVENVDPRYGELHFDLVEPLVVFDGLRLLSLIRTRFNS
jgi:hypothetical protein